MVDKRKLSRRLMSSDWGKVGERAVVGFQCSLAIGVLILLSVHLVPVLVSVRSDGTRFLIALLLGLLTSIALDPTVRYIRTIWRGDRDD
ncbi:hypothetical protein B7C42_00233 [Nocardia cerradoensis]|uniref:Uncharacterized protein n=1 Tax=Nocardia cerradoensis TaxID=85688 RepID=A0A231HDV4_9NOCA|nr:hypothetical protein [Nocardia cerradoensis]OXR47111.1 hypothetical protein B7C42_00233 [Nocardia cerradoensis]